MTEEGTDALEQALALHSAPGRASMLSRRRLPGDVLGVIRVAAGDRDFTESAAARTGVTRATLIEAAKLYLQRVLFDESADCYRVLGVRSDAPPDLVKLHHRWLVRWLHPDRAAERWESVYAERVNRAWHTLSSPERRTRYDEERLQASGASADRRVSSRQNRLERALRSPDIPAVLSPRMVRWMPAIVFAGLATASAVVLGALYWDQLPAEETAPGPKAPESPASAVVDAASPPAVAARLVRAALVPAEAVKSPPEIGPAPGAAQAAVTGPAPSSVLDRGIASVHSAVGPLADPGAAGPPRRDGPGPGLRPLMGGSNPPAGDPPALAAAALPPSRPAPRGPARIDAPNLPAAGPDVHAGQRSDEPGVSARTTPSLVVEAAATSRLAAASQHPAERVSADALVDAPRAALVPVADAPTNAMSPQDAATFVTRSYVLAYQQGDLAGLMRLFAPDAVNDRGGIETIARDYARFFHDTRARTLNISRLSWVYGPKRIIGTGSFDASVTGAADSTPRLIRGWMRIEAIPIDGLWKIHSLQHGNPR